jgi:hypothetical protein
MTINPAKKCIHFITTVLLKTARFAGTPLASRTARPNPSLDCSRIGMAAAQAGSNQTCPLAGLEQTLAARLPALFWLSSARGASGGLSSTLSERGGQLRSNCCKNISCSPVIERCFSATEE